jgi:hypothetical protein
MEALSEPGPSGGIKTRPSAQYAANGLASPDIEIGLRHPVNYILRREHTSKCDPFHNRRKKQRQTWRCAGSAASGRTEPLAAI